MVTPICGYKVKSGLMTIEINPSDYKLIAFDLDGTLIHNRSPISSFTKQVLERLRAKGYQYTIATGRILSGVKEYADELTINIPLVMSNGGILQTRQGELITQTCLPLDALQTTMKLCQENNSDLALYIRDQIYVEKLNENMQTIYGCNQDDLYEIGPWETISEKFPDVNKCVIIDSDDEQNLIDLQPKLDQSLNGSAVTLRTSPILLEVQPNDITKAIGLQNLADHLGINIQEIIAFGDYDNDAEMLKAVGLGIAVGEATPACLANADLLVASAEEDGPAHFLEDHFLI